MTSCVHKMCGQTYGQTNMKRATTLAKINHPWNRYNMRMITISRMVDFCENYSPFHVCLTIRPFTHLVYASSQLSFVAFYSYLVSWLAMIWACAYYTENATKDKWLVVYTRCADGRMVKQTWKGLQLSQKSTIREIGIICTCIHIWYLGWPWSEHAQFYRFHGWLIFARVVAFFMFVWPYVRSHILCTPQVICL
jgi:hypothetical protein